MNTQRLQGRLGFLTCVVILFVAAGLIGASPVQADTTYSGRAFAAFVNTSLTGPVYITDTGALAPSGGFRGDALVDTRNLNLATLDSILTAQVLAASTSGASGTASSSASLANVVLLPGSATELRASFVRAESTATCSGVNGTAEVADLTFGGSTIAVTGEPNQTVTIPGGATLVINEQTTSTNGTYRQIQVNALHLTVPGVAEVILSSAESDITCTGAVSQGPCHDFVTGGGWIPTAGGDRGNFGLHAGLKPNSSTPEVHLNYIDHGSGMKVTATSITMYVPGATTTSRHLEGDAEVDGMPGYTYKIDVADNGEPGRGVDSFSLSLSNGYQAGGTLGGGNIQLHKPCP